MILTLEITAPRGVKAGVLTRQTFDQDGGTIGRDGKNRWVLPNTEVSGCHARISYRHSIFYIEDTRSTNGVCINSPDNRLVPSRPYALKSGDRIIIRPYEISVSIADASAAPLPDWQDARTSSPRSGSSPFEIAEPFESSNPFASGDSPGSPAGVTSAAGRSAEELDPLNLLGGGTPKRTPSQKPPAARDLARGSMLEQHYQPPDAHAPPAQPESGLVPPDHYNPLADDPADPPPAAGSATPKPVSSRPIDAGPPTPAPRRSPAAGSHADPPLNRNTSQSGQTSNRTSRARPEPALGGLPGRDEIRRKSGGDDAAEAARNDLKTEVEHAVPKGPPAAASSPFADLSEVLRGAGFDDAEVTPELARNFGRILRVVVGGLMEVLQARQQIKEEFRMRMTHVQPADNNPLKFSANVDDALHNLLVKRSAAYLGPVEAFVDAFEDLRKHQMAMLAGMQVAFEGLMAEFDADYLQEQFDRQLGKGSLVPAKLRYWDLYRERRRDMVKDPDEAFRTLFGEEFARAYEEQFARLKAELRAAGDKGPPASRQSEE